MTAEQVFKKKTEPSDSAFSATRRADKVLDLIFFLWMAVDDLRIGIDGCLSFFRQ